MYQGLIIDDEFVNKFKKFNIVYSWGDLHHTGEMHHAIEDISSLVEKDGSLFISIYNDKGEKSQKWKWIKKHTIIG